ncbi:MAG: leucine-rich repeat domain-containing protein [Puniceicoccaceae bacterium]
MKGFMRMSLAVLFLTGCLHQMDAQQTFGSFEYEVNNDEVTITKFLCDTAEAVIPAEIGGLPVTAIGDSSFEDCASLTTVNIPDNVASIGRAAFAFCGSLTNLIIPDSVSFIDDYAFGFCTSLTSVTIGESVTEIGYGAFTDCSGLTSVYFMGEPPTIENSLLFVEPSELVIYYLEDKPGWGSTFDGIPTAPFTPSSSWGIYSIYEVNGDTFADTGSWLGVLYVDLAPWVYCYDMESWLLIPEEQIGEDGGWAYASQ